MRIGIVIPTYNEKDTILKLLGEINHTFVSNGLNGHIVVVDDNSPDGTGTIVSEAAKQKDWLSCLVRGRKLGLGSAYKTGFSYILDNLSADVIFEMDADFSHNPIELPSFLALICQGFDVVLGTRNLEGAQIVGWGTSRKLVSKVANALARVACRISVHDATTGYRAFTRQALEKIDFRTLRSHGFDFQIESLARCKQAGLRIGEVPIVFVNRQRGTSKLGVTEMMRFLRTVGRLYIDNPARRA